MCVRVKLMLTSNSLTAQKRDLKVEGGKKQPRTSKTL